MKKILSAVAALGLVAGVATTASALEFKVSGHYFVEGVYLSSGDSNGLVLNDEDTGNDAYWMHEFVIKPTMKVNDKITIKSKIYLAQNYWGENHDSGATDANDNMEVQHIYMEYMSPVGKVRMGRTSAGLWMGDFMSSDLRRNRLMYFPNWLPENMGACFFLQKSNESDGTDGLSEVDGDSDGYEAAFWYKTKDLIASLALDYNRDATNDTQMSNWYRLKGYYNQNFAKMYVEAEFQYDFGETEFDAAGTSDMDIDQLGFMADVGMKMDKLDVGMMFIYGSGDDDGTDDSNDANGALGEQFQPYNILTGRHTGMMVSDVAGADGDMSTAGIISLGVHANFSVSDALSLNTALAYAQAESERTGFDDEYGWELDLGVAYNLMDNLTYQVDFGYLMTGDFFETATQDAEDVFTLTHRLTMEF